MFETQRLKNPIISRVPVFVQSCSNYHKRIKGRRPSLYSIPPASFLSHFENEAMLELLFRFVFLNQHIISLSKSKWIITFSSIFNSTERISFSKCMSILPVCFVTNKFSLVTICNKELAFG